MQVSWIDPDEVRALLAQIEVTRTATNASAWEVHTLPIAPPAVSEATRLLSETANNDPRTPAPEFQDHRPGPGNAELWRIREKLRALREKAQESGILPPPRTPELEGSTASVSQAVAAPEPDALPTETSADYEPLFSGTMAIPALEPERVEATARHSDTQPVQLEKAPAFVVPSVGLGERLAALAEWACDRLATRDLLLVDDYGDVLWGGQEQTPLVLSAMMAWQSTQHSNAATTTGNAPSRIDKTLNGGRALTILSTRTSYGVVNLAAIRSEPIAEAEAEALQDALLRAVEGVTSA